MNAANAARDTGSAETTLAGGDAAVARILRRLAVGGGSGERLIEVLADELPGADLTTLLLEVHRRRASRLTPADVMRRYGSDRFVAPAPVSAAALRRSEDVMLRALPDGFDVLTLAPVLPLGTHWATGEVDPRNVIATIRGSEVAADPTNGLALEAALRRRRALGADPRSATVVRLATTQRVTRAQLFSGPASFAHFQLLGLVTAGRDIGGRAFEREHLAEHLRFAANGLKAAGLADIAIAVTCLDEPSRQVMASVADGIARLAGVKVAEAPDRESGRAYYRGLCFKVFAARSGQEPLEVADGGFVDWTAKLLGNRKERLLISGYGVDRVTLLSAAVSAGPVAPRMRRGPRAG